MTVGGGAVASPYSKPARVQVQPLRIGRSVAYVAKPELLCHGHAGVGRTKFFLLTSSRCATVSHQRSKETAIRPGLYLLDQAACSSRTACFVNPWVAVDHLSESVLKSLLLQELSHSQAVAAFSLLSSKVIHEEETMVEATNAQIEAKVARTPSNQNQATIFRQSTTDLSRMISVSWSKVS